MIGAVLDTDIRSVAAGRSTSSWQQSTGYMRSFIADGGETPTAVEKMAYIQRFMGSEANQALKQLVIAWVAELTALAVRSNELITAEQMINQEEELTRECANILKPRDSQAAFKMAGLVCLAASLVSTYFYCDGIAPLFTEATENEHLSEWMRQALTFFGAATPEGAKMWAYLSAGMFSIIHSTDGFRMVFRDGPLKIAAVQGMAARGYATAEWATTSALAGFSALTAAFESGGGSPGNLLQQVTSILGGVKGASVNVKGAQLAAASMLSGLALVGRAMTSGVSCATEATTGAFSGCFRGRSVVETETETLLPT